MMTSQVGRRRFHSADVGGVMLPSKVVVSGTRVELLPLSCVLSTALVVFSDKLWNRDVLGQPGAIVSK